MKTRNAAVAGVGQAHNGGQAETCHHADYGSGSEYPARAHSHRARHVKPPFRAAPSVQSGLASGLDYGLDYGLGYQLGYGLASKWCRR